MYYNRRVNDKYLYYHSATCTKLNVVLRYNRWHATIKQCSIRIGFQGFLMQMKYIKIGLVADKKYEAPYVKIYDAFLLSVDGI